MRIQNKKKIEHSCNRNLIKSQRFFKIWNVCHFFFLQHCATMAHTLMFTYYSNAKKYIRTSAYQFNPPWVMMTTTNERTQPMRSRQNTAVQLRANFCFDTLLLYTVRHPQLRADKRKMQHIQVLIILYKFNIYFCISFFFFSKLCWLMTNKDVQ